MKMPAAKRKRVSTSLDLSAENFSNLTTLDAKFNVFPRALRERLQNALQAAMQLPSAAAKARAGSTYTYVLKELNVTRAEGLQSGEIRALSIDSEDLEDANVLLLEYFLKRYYTRFWPTGTERQLFREMSLKVGEMDSNPKLVRSAPIVQGVIGWGFDEVGCLGLRAVETKSGKLVVENFFVQRVERKEERSMGGSVKVASPTVHNPSLARSNFRPVKVEEWDGED